MEVDIVVNNAGFGDFGDYRADNLDKEMNMIDLNVKSRFGGISDAGELALPVKRTGGYLPCGAAARWTKN